MQLKYENEIIIKSIIRNNKKVSKYHGAALLTKSCSISLYVNQGCSETLQLHFLIPLFTR
jgi:hypothetical protein